MKRLFSTILAALTLCVAAAHAQINVQAPPVVSVGESFNVVFSIEGKEVKDFSWETTNDFEVVWGPQTGSSTSISIINGTTTRTSTHTYTYVLTASKAGTFEIPAASAKVKGGAISSQPFKIKVVAGTGSASASGASSASSNSVDVFLKLNLSKTNVVVGEPVTAELKLYQRANISGFEDIVFPEFTGFWSQETFSASNVEFKREAVDNEVYNVALLRAYNLIPQQVGDLTIDRAHMVCLVNVRSQTSAMPRSIFDQFFADDYKTIRKRVSTEPVTVHVRNLPTPAPESFCGGVGSFSISASVSRDSLMAHDAASYYVKVTGKGNLNLLEAPKVKFPSDFDVYDVKISDSNGVRTFEYPFIPRTHGSFVIPELEFSYYDFGSSSYKTVSTKPLRVEVSRNALSEQAGSGVAQFIGVGARDVKDIGSDIRYINVDAPALVRKGSFLLFSAAFFIILAVLIIAAAVIYAGICRYRKIHSDEQGLRRRGASKMARTRLSRAGEYLKQNLSSAFYEELHRALLGFVSDKLSLDSSDLSKETISSRLLSAGAPQGLVTEFTDLLDSCEFARYAPSSTSDSMEILYTKALNLISALDSAAGKKASVSKALSLVALLTLLPLGISASAQTPQQLWTSATEAYAQGDYQGAYNTLHSIEEMGLESAALYYNLGCASFKLSDYAHAVLYFQRTLKLDPTYKDASVNLEFTRAFLQDKIDSVPEFFLLSWIHSVRACLSSNAWTVLFLILFALLIACVLIYSLGREVLVRKAGFFGGIAALVLCVICFANAQTSRAAALDTSAAVVVSPVSTVRSAPDNSTGTDLFVLHEGAQVKILHSIGTWRNISLSDGRQGWIQSGSLEVI